MNILVQEQTLSEVQRVTIMTSMFAQCRNFVSDVCNGNINNIDNETAKAVEHILLEVNTLQNQLDKEIS
jgi:hypothetical protein